MVLMFAATLAYEYTNPHVVTLRPGGEVPICGLAMLKPGYCPSRYCVKIFLAFDN